MEELVKVMNPEVQYTLSELIGLCQKRDLFDWIVGAANLFGDDLQPKIRSKFGKLLKAYDGRSFRSRKRFQLTG